MAVTWARTTRRALGNALSGRPEQGAGWRTPSWRATELDAARGPLAIVIEDLQHADDESLDELDRLSAELADAPILLVATARPDLLVRRPAGGTAAPFTRASTCRRRRRAISTARARKRRTHG